MHKIVTTNVVTLPVRNNSWDQGAKFGRLSVETDTPKTVAYGVAIADSLYYANAADYLRGFLEAFRIEEEKRMLA